MDENVFDFDKAKDGMLMILDEHMAGGLTDEALGGRRDHGQNIVDLYDAYGTAMFNGFPAALMDLADVDSMDGRKLCGLVEREGVDLRRLVVDDD